MNIDVKRTLAALAIPGLMVVAAACGGGSDDPQSSPTVVSTTDPGTTSTANTTPSQEPASPTASSVAASSEKLNLNTVTGDELLATIPGFTDRFVREFQEYQPYVSIQQFRREIGKYVDEAQVAKWETYVYVPISINDSDAETIMQIPGIDEATADALVASRPYASNADFLTKLSATAPSVEATVAASLLDSE